MCSAQQHLITAIQYLKRGEIANAYLELQHGHIEWSQYSEELEETKCIRAINKANREAKQLAARRASGSIKSV